MTEFELLVLRFCAFDVGLPAFEILGWGGVDLAFGALRGVGGEVDGRVGGGGLTADVLW